MPDRTPANPIPMSRRQALQSAAILVTATALTPQALAHGDGRPAFALTAMPYAYDALEPHLDAQTMEIHHRRHHKTYVDTLNRAVESLPEPHPDGLESLLRNLDRLPGSVRSTIRNHGGGHYNHDLFWRSLKAAPGGAPPPDLARALDDAFGSFSAFQTTFTQAALGRFGSGWAWLVWQAGKLQVVSTANQDCPLMGEVVAGCAGEPLLGLDVWEHAYYLKFQNRRADYIAAWWNVVNWDFVAGRFRAVAG